jgi:membrane-associated protease RseP (regulator of RpoE activity)
MTTPGVTPSRPFLRFAVPAALLAAVAVVAWTRLRQTGSEPERGRAMLTEANPCLQAAPNHWRVLKSARDRYLGDMARVNFDVALLPQPGPEKDSVAELLIARLAPDGPLQAAGFRKGDRILLVNGRPVTTMSRALGLADEIRSASRLDVQVERNGVVMDYRFDIEQGP